jgi:hypothetical protein
MNKYLTSHTVILTLGLLALSCLFLSPLSALGEAPLKVLVPSKSGSYKPGDVIKISWTPASTPIQTIKLIPTKKNSRGIYLYSELVSGDPILTNGSYNYTFSDSSVPSGSYYVGIGLPGTTDTVAQSSKAIKIESKPSLYFGSVDGSGNIAISSGSSVTLKWEATSVKNCKASSVPSNSKWKKSVKPSGTKKIRVTTPTTFYLTCQNSLGSVSTSLQVDTGAPARSTAKLIPSTSFITTNFKLGTSRNDALIATPDISVFNSSEIEPIYFRFITKDQPQWINTGYNTAQMSIPPQGTAGVGAFADPSMVSGPGTYKWNLQIEGNFSNSPLVIPVTMNVTY